MTPFSINCSGVVVVVAIVHPPKSEIQAEFIHPSIDDHNYTRFAFGVEPKVIRALEQHQHSSNPGSVLCPHARSLIHQEF